MGLPESPTLKRIPTSSNSSRIAAIQNPRADCGRNCAPMILRACCGLTPEHRASVRGEESSLLTLPPGKQYMPPKKRMPSGRLVRKTSKPVGADGRRRITVAAARTFVVSLTIYLVPVHPRKSYGMAGLCNSSSQIAISTEKKTKCSMIPCRRSRGERKSRHPDW